ncbi:hypothetical protein NDU88_009045 [Pleurodeles waltl]|uniref:Uncharacterized protein n=1 Tax=Pleurodeles waltl TaxID=8319 RepID=A0AAV7RU54_PLEWA|nr:hypothetical protein NDU88_009045 [Pleurodeles waltl]
MRVSARVGPRPEASGPSVTTGSLALPVGPLGNMAEEKVRQALLLLEEVGSLDLLALATLGRRSGGSVSLVAPASWSWCWHAGEFSGSLTYTASGLQ